MGMSCTHQKITKVLTIGDCEVHAGSESQVRDRGHEFDLIISLTGRSNRKPVNFRMSRGSLRMLSALNEYMKRKMHTIIIDWPDMSVPDLDVEFWQALYTDLSHMKGRAVIHCMGGHGRTGTALAILAFLHGASGDHDAVTWVRTQYCQEAVETASQIRYLQDEIGIPTHAGPSSSYKHSPPQTTRGLTRYFGGHQGALPAPEAPRLFPKVDSSFELDE